MADKKITDLPLRDEFDNDCNIPVDDTIQSYRVTATQIYDYLKPTYQGAMGLLKNVGLSVSAAAGAMTVALKQANGSTNPTTGIGRSEVLFRSTTLTSGAQSLIDFDAALSLVIPSGATLDFQNGDDARVYVYLYYDGTDKGLAVTSKRVDETQLYSLVGIGTGSDSNAIYADANRTTAALRLIGMFQVSTITTAGTWTTPTYVAPVSSMPFRKGLLATKVITSTSTYYKNPDADFIVVEVVGGGGGGGGAEGGAGTGGSSSSGGGGAGGGMAVKTILNSAVGDTESVTIGAAGTAGAASGGGNGGTGGTSSFGAHCSATGGSGGSGDAALSSSTSVNESGGQGGAGSGGDINKTGQGGGRSMLFGGPAYSGPGGVSPFDAGAGYGVTLPSVGITATGYGCGGSGGATGNGTSTDRAGGAGFQGIVVVREYKI